MTNDSRTIFCSECRKCQPLGSDCPPEFKISTSNSTNRTSPYEFYQYWVNQGDADMETLFKKFTFLDAERISELLRLVELGENRGDVQRKLAHEVTRMVHGEGEADKAARASQVLFGGPITGLTDHDLSAIFSEVPSSFVDRDRMITGVSVIDLFAEAGLIKTKGEGRRLLEQGGIYINNERIESDILVTLKHLASETKIVLRTGKKKYHIISIFDKIND